MNSAGTGNEVSAVYSARLGAQRGKREAAERRHKQLGYLKLVVVAATILVLVLGLKAEIASAWWLIVPIVALAFLEKTHERVLGSLKRCTRTMAFYERGLARMEDRWMSGGETGEDFLEPEHPYARDLDLFGKGSLFELLCTARTSAGKNILAEWLLGATSVPEIESRQEAVRELAPRLDFREDIAASGEDIRSRERAEALLAWAEAPPELHPKVVRVAALILSVGWLLSLLVWAVLGVWELTLVISVVNRIFYSHFSSRCQKIIGAETFVREFALLPILLTRMEQEKFASAKLVELQTRLRQHGVSSAASIGKLRRLTQALESRRSLLIAVSDSFVLWTTQVALAIETWRQEFAPAFRVWLMAVGEMEALNALANYSYERPEDVFPQFLPERATLEASGLAHPLLPRSRAIRNDVKLSAELRVMIVSGPNMSGKSTFIRAIGLNGVLAHCGAPVCAKSLRLSTLQVTASICILDSLQGGVSRFYAEIKRLKLIAELAQKPKAVLFLLDELLSGTNSDDRRAGSEAFVESMVARGAIGLVTTHDLALTRMVDKLPMHAANFHFEDRIENGELRFDYRLVAGVAQSSNALKLMRSIGLEV
jgi:MutS-like protein